MNQTNSTFDAMLKAAISHDSAGATDTMLIHAHLAQMKMFGIRQGVEFYPEQDNFGSQRYDFIQQVIDWETSIDPHFKKNNYRPSKILEQGKWGRRMQIFFDEFYGEAIEIQPGKSFTRNADERPFAGIVWSGEGEINNNKLNGINKEQKEFLVTPSTQVEIKNKGATPLLVYTVFPLQN